MVLLQILGKEGKTNESHRQVFKTAYGANNIHRNRVVQALTDLCKEYIQWPDGEEYKEIASQIEKSFHFPNCIGLMDGTSLPLAFDTSSDNAADYHGRRFPYSLTVSVINDDKQQIRAHLAGYPGSTHDNRLWLNMKQNNYSHKFFSTSECVLCDTAFEPRNICIPAYKTDAAFYQSAEKVKFNKAMSPLCVITEHTKDLWKSQLPWLRSIRIRIANNPECLEKILDYIDYMVVLHYILIEFGNVDDNDNALWDIGEEHLSDIGDVT